MKTAIPVTLLLIAAAVAPVAVNATLIGDTFINNQAPLGNNSGIGSFGEDPANPGNPPAYFAQSFVAPGGLAEELTFELLTNVGPGDHRFRVLLTELTTQTESFRPGGRLVRPPPRTSPCCCGSRGGVAPSI